MSRVTVRLSTLEIFPAAVEEEKMGEKAAHLVCFVL